MTGKPSQISAHIHHHAFFEERLGSWIWRVVLFWSFPNFNRMANPELIIYGIWTSNSFVEGYQCHTSSVSGSFSYWEWSKYICGVSQDGKRMKTPGTSQADPVRGNRSFSSQVSSEKKSAVKTWLLSSSNGKSTYTKKHMERHVMISDSKNLTVDLYSFWRSTDSNQRASFTHLGNPDVWDHTRGPLKHLSSRREAASNGFCSKAMRPLPFWTSDFWSSKFGTSSIFFYK